MSADEWYKSGLVSLACRSMRTNRIPSTPAVFSLDPLVADVALCVVLLLLMMMLLLQCSIRLPCGHCDYDQAKRRLLTFCDVAGSRIKVGRPERWGGGQLEVFEFDPSAVTRPVPPDVAWLFCRRVRPTEQMPWPTHGFYYSARIPMHNLFFCFCF